MAPVREVAFELECFEWAEERLEVAGRWKGLGARRLNRPVLTVQTEQGRRKRIVAMPGGQLGIAGETWRASFSWPGDPADITGAALEVGGSLVVDLPLPDRRRRRRWRAHTTDQADEALRAEVGALRGQIERLRAELAGREREIITLRAQSDDEPGEAAAGADDRTVEFERLAGERDAVRAELERLQAERMAGAEAMTVEAERLAAERDAVRAELERSRVEHDEAVAAERARWQAELDELREAFSDAAAEAEESRDRHREAVAGLEAQLRAERAESARASAQMAGRPDRRGHASTPARRLAAEPPTQPLVAPPTASGDAVGAPDDAARAPGDTAPAPGDTAPAPDDTEPAPGDAVEAADRTRDHLGDAAADPTATMPDPLDLPGAALDAPGPLRAGARPVSPSGVEQDAAASRVPAFLRRAASADAPELENSGGALHALKERLESLFASNGHEPAPDAPPAQQEPAVPRPRRSAAQQEPVVPRPRRSAAAARARAGATAAARRSPAEVLAMRVLAVVVVAVLLTAFVLILTGIA